MSSLPVLIDAEPAPDTTPDSPLFSRERQATFLSALAGTGNVRSASACAGVSHQTAYRTRLASPGFRRGWDAALLAARAQAEEVLACRALDGWEEDVVYHGEVVATRRRYSDRLLLAHLGRLDRLCGDDEVAQFAEDFDQCLTRFGAGEDRPARVDEAAVAAAGAEGAGCSPEQWSTWSTERAAPGAIPPPLPARYDARGAPLGEAQQLEIGLYRHWWDAELDCWLTNWPAAPGWQGEEYRIESDGAAVPLDEWREGLDGPEDAAAGEGRYWFDADDRADAEDDAEAGMEPGGDHWARTLSAEEEAGLERRAEAEAAQRAGRIDLYRRAALGLAGPAELAAIRAADKACGGNRFGRPNN